MNIKRTVTDVQISHDDLVNLFSTALYGDNTFSAWVDEANAHLKNKGEGDCYEDKLANVLLNGGYICISDNEADEDDKNSEVLELAGNDEGVPFYHVTLDRIKQAFKEIHEGKTTGTYSNGLMQNFNATFVDEDGDFYDAWNLLQYIVFGEVVYG